MKSRWLRVLTILAFAGAGLAANVARSQTTGGIEGTVTDSNDAPLPGAAVDLQSPSLQGGRTAVTSAAGRYRFPAIPPGTYTVTCSLSGFKKVERRGIHVNLDTTVSVPIKMEISVTQEIVVSGEAPVVDTNDAANGLNIRQDVVQKLPLGRNYAQAVEINPGVGIDSGDTQGRAQAFSIYGATSIENQYLVDGVNTTNVIRGFQGKAISSEFVEEVQVKAGGYEAEYGRAMGGIVNVVTKSGGNEFHGDAFGYFNTKSLTADRKGDATTDQNYTGPPAGVDTSQADVQDMGVDLGGYAIKDRLWFFGAYNRVNQDVDQLTLAGTGLPNAGENFPITYHADLFSGKLTGRPTDTTTIVGTIFGDPEIRTGAQRNFTSDNPLSQDGTRKIGATDFAVGINQLFGVSALADVRYSRHQDRYTLTGEGASTVSVLDYTQDLANPTASGGFGSIRGFRDYNQSKRDAIKGSATLFFGAHEIKGGIDFENNLTESTDIYSGGSRLRIYACNPQVCTGAMANAPLYYGHEFYTLTTDKQNLQSAFLASGNTVSPRVYRLGAFAQDAWKVLPNLSVHVGLRYDQEDVRQYDGTKIYNSQVVDASGHVLQQGGQQFFLKNEWQPRIGIAWDPAKDGSTKVSASYGRFYYALPTDLTVRSYAAKIDAITYNYNPGTNQADLAQDPTIGKQAFTQGGLNPEPFQDDLKGIYQDEYAIGFEKALSSSLSVGVRYTYRDLGRTIEDRCDFDAGYPEANNNTCVIINPGSSSPFATGQGVHTCDGRDYIDASGNSAQSECTGPQTTNVAIPAAERKFHGVEFVVKGRVSNQLWAQFSYLWSHLYGNYNGEASIAEFAYPGGGQTDPGINADYDYPLFLNNAYGNLALDRRHQFRLDGTYTLPFGLTMALSAHVRSGSPLSEYGYFNSGYGAEGYQVVPAGSAGRTPWDYDFNLSASYAFRVSAATITLLAQGYNLLNRQDILGYNQDCTIAPPPSVAAVTNCSVVSNPTSANPNYGLVSWRANPRVLKLGARVSF
ncbi:MAG TPA: TonB-dependent receptor [Thermoanaerobaculia bacterium]|nr:TonB-dependent receptor [Thermoanaerobaculia bacterium]